VTKLVKSNETTVPDRQLLFEAVGFEFPTRLLQTGKHLFLITCCLYWTYL